MGCKVGSAESQILVLSGSTKLEMKAVLPFNLWTQSVESARQVHNDDDNRDQDQNSQFSEQTELLAHAHHSRLSGMFYMIAIDRHV